MAVVGHDLFEMDHAFGSGGGEAIDIALKSARHATKRRKIVSIIKAYHGHTGLAVATGDDRFAKMFLADQPDEFIQVPCRKRTSFLFSKGKAKSENAKRGETIPI